MAWSPANFRNGWGDRVRIEEASKTLWGVSLLIVVFTALGVLLSLAALMIKRH